MSTVLFSITDFLEEYPRFKTACSNPQAEVIFALLIEPENIQHLIVATKLGRPALEGVIEKMESHFHGLSELEQSLFDLHEHTVRHAIGSMVQFILKDFGYKKCGSKVLSARANSILKTASTYELHPDFVAKYAIEIVITQIK